MALFEPGWIREKNEASEERTQFYLRRDLERAQSEVIRLHKENAWLKRELKRLKK